MPNYFKIYRKDDPNQTAVPFAHIDDELCAHLGVAPDPERFYSQWYDILGEAFAAGFDLGNEEKIHEIRRCLNNSPKLLQVLDWLNENFRSTAWYHPL